MNCNANEVLETKETRKNMYLYEQVPPHNICYKRFSGKRIINQYGHQTIKEVKKQ